MAEKRLVYLLGMDKHVVSDAGLARRHVTNLKIILIAIVIVAIVTGFAITLMRAQDYTIPNSAINVGQIHVGDIFFP